MGGSKACKSIRSTSFACPTCGTIKKPGKSTCCAPGGSWFRDCGSAGNVKRRHTWYDGMQACKTRARSEIAVEQQRGVVQHTDTSSSNGVAKANSAADIVSNTTSSRTPVVKT